MVEDVHGELDATWESVSTDADLAPDTVEILPVHAGSAAALGAVYFAPGEAPDRSRADFPLSQEQIAKLARRTDDHVIALNLDQDPRLVPLVLRHEAEHVVQQLHSSEAARLATLIAAVEAQHAGMALNPVLPHERDADASCRLYALKNGIEASAEDLESANRFLFKAPWTHEADETVETLPVRLLAWVLMLPRGYVSVETSVKRLYRDESKTRQTLAHLRPESRLQEITAHGVDQDAFDKMSRREQLAFQDELRIKVVAAEREIARAIAELKSTPSHRQ